MQKMTKMISSVVIVDIGYRQRSIIPELAICITLPFANWSILPTGPHGT